MEILFEQYLELKKIQKFSKVENSKNETTNRPLRRAEWTLGIDHVRFPNKISKQSTKSSISVTKMTEMVTEVVTKTLEDRATDQLKMRYHIRQLRIAHFNMKKKACKV